MVTPAVMAGLVETVPQALRVRTARLVVHLEPSRAPDTTRRMVRQAGWAATGAAAEAEVEVEDRAARSATTEAVMAVAAVAVPRSG